MKWFAVMENACDKMDSSSRDSSMVPFRSDAPCSFYYVMIEGQMKMRFVVGEGEEVKVDFFIKSWRMRWFSLAHAFGNASARQ